MGNCFKKARNDDVSLLRGNESIQRDNSDQAIATIYESQNNGRNAYYETGPTFSNNRPVDQLSEEEQIKMAKRIGLIQYLPIGTYDGCKKTRECVICMVEFQPADTLRYLPCMHKYHVKCIDDWLMRSLTCPSCLEPVDAALLTSYEN